MSKIKIFRGEYNNFEVEIKVEDIELKGIAYDEDNNNLAYLVDNNDENAAFNDVEVAYVDGDILVGFTDPTRWEVDNIIEGTFEDK